MSDREAFNGAVTDLIGENITDRSERIKAVEGLIDAYMDSTGMPPEHTQLERLADYLLSEELNDKSSDKAAKNDCPFHSPRQTMRRYSREASDSAASNIGVDGQNHRIRKRRKRNRWETDYVDRHAKIRNAERKAQYKKDTAPGPVFTYYIDA